MQNNGFIISCASIESKKGILKYTVKVGKDVISEAVRAIKINGYEGVFIEQGLS